MYMFFSFEVPLLEARKLSRVLSFLYTTSARSVVHFSSECYEIMSTTRSPHLPKHPMKKEKMRNLTRDRLQSSGMTRHTHMKPPHRAWSLLPCGDNMKGLCLPRKPADIQRLTILCKSLNFTLPLF